jgi:hypothetical protein
MTTVQRNSEGHYVVDGRSLSNGDELEVRLGGNQGWKSVTVAGLPATLRVVFEADDGTRIVTSLSSETPVRWP